MQVCVKIALWLKNFPELEENIERPRATGKEPNLGQAYAVLDRAQQRRHMRCFAVIGCRTGINRVCLP